MRVTLSNFGGIVPRLSPHSLPATQATVAHDVKLRNGRLEPWRELCEYQSVPLSTASFHLHGCCAVAWDMLVDAAEVSPDWGRFYITGRTGKPEVVEVACDCSPSYTLLGVPAPITPPRAHGSEKCSRAADARAYVYTYVNKWGEESAPSPASNTVTVEDGATVTVTNIALPPDGYGIVKANIYRATTGFREENAKHHKPLTDFLYVATITFPSTTYSDSVKMVYLRTALDTVKVTMPPDKLHSITSIDGVVRLAGAVDNRVHLSENFQPYNWPAKHTLTLDSSIVHMGSYEQKLYVTTDTTPYVIDVSSCEDIKCTPVLDVAVPLPDIACKYVSAAIMTRFGFIYSSPLGLVLIDANARYNILTKNWFNARDWEQLQPETIRMAMWEGFLFFMTDAPGASFALNIDTEPYGDMLGSELTTLSDKPVDLKISSTGKLFLLQNAKLSVWDTGEKFRPFMWQSRELTSSGHRPAEGLGAVGSPLGSTWTPTSAKVRSEGVEFSLTTPWREDAFKRTITHERPFRLPRLGRHTWYKVTLRGNKPVEFVDIGTSHFTVNEGA